MNSARGHDLILVAVDRLSRYKVLMACPTGCTAEQTIEILQRNLAQYGDPLSFVCDRDSRFKSEAFKEYCASLGFEPILASSDHHETVGLAERAIQSIKVFLRHYINAEHTNWDALLPAAQRALNEDYCDSIGCSPSYYVFGVDPSAPAITYQYPEEHSHRAEWQRACKAARDRLELMRTRQAASANKKRRDVRYRVGEEVLLSTRHPAFRSLDGVKKLIAPYVGPFKITYIANKVTCTLDLPPEMKFSNQFHVALLKRYHPATRRPDPPAPETDDAGEEHFEVESILSHRDRAGRQREYRVAFKGYGPDRNLWLPLSSLEGCPDSIADYWKRVELDIGKRAVAGKTTRSMSRGM